MEILKLCRIILAQIGLSTDKSIFIMSKNVPLIIIRVIILAFQLTHWILQITNCIEYYNNDIDAFLTAIHFVAATTANAIVYITLILSSSRIVVILDFIQVVVDERMLLECANVARKDRPDHNYPVFIVPFYETISRVSPIWLLGRYLPEAKLGQQQNHDAVQVVHFGVYWNGIHCSNAVSSSFYDYRVAIGGPVEWAIRWGDGVSKLYNV